MHEPLRRPLCCVGVLCVAMSIPAVGSQAQAQGPLRIYSPTDPLQTDPNGLLLNPRWRGLKSPQPPDVKHECGFRATTGHLDRRQLVTTAYGCLSPEERQLVTLNEIQSTLYFGSVCVTSGKVGNIRGHVNWFPVTARGELTWDSFSSGVQDHDVNINLTSDVDSAALTSANAGGYHTETYYEETLDRIPDFGGTFWQRLKQVLVNKKPPHDLVDTRPATMTGLYGVDGVHAFHAELHPVYALSVLVDTTVNGRDVTEDWAVMVRNLGSEGDCSEGVLPLITGDEGAPAQDFFIDLGWWPGAEPAGVALDPSWVSDTTFVPEAMVADGEEPHFYVNVRHPRPHPGDRDFLFLGTIRLTWHLAQGAVPWSQRLAPWVRTPPIASKLARVGDGSAEAVAKSLRKLHSQVWYESDGAPGAWTAPSVDSLRPLKPRVLSIETLPAPIQLPRRVLKTPPWPIADSVPVADCLTRNPVCLPGKRWGLGFTAPSVEQGPQPMLSFIVLPHTAYRPGDRTIDNVLNIIWTLGFRYDLRYEQFVPFRESGDTTLRLHPRRSGASFRFSPFVSPATVRFSRYVSVAPYTIGNLGLSWLSGDDQHWFKQLDGSHWTPHGLSFTSGWGGGLQWTVWGQDFQTEVQNLGRAQGYFSQMVFTTTLMLPCSERRLPWPCGS